MTDRDAIKEAVREAFKEELKEFYVDRETHYNHHKFIGEWMDWTSQCKSTFLKVLIGLVSTAVFGLIAAGFVIKMGFHK